MFLDVVRGSSFRGLKSSMAVFSGSGPPFKNVTFGLRLADPVQASGGVLTVILTGWITHSQPLTSSLGFFS